MGEKFIKAVYRVLHKSYPKAKPASPKGQGNGLWEDGGRCSGERGISPQETFQLGPGLSDTNQAKTI